METTLNEVAAQVHAQKDERYRPVDMVLPEVMPPVTRKRALSAAKRIFLHFGGVRHGSAMMYKPSRLSWWVPKKGRTCWASTKPTRGHHKGWGRMIHDVSHAIFRDRHPRFRPHDNGHAQLEREIAAYVVEKGWLNE